MHCSGFLFVAVKPRFSSYADFIKQCVARATLHEYSMARGNTWNKDRHATLWGSWTQLPSIGRSPPKPDLPSLPGCPKPGLSFCDGPGWPTSTTRWPIAPSFEPTAKFPQEAGRPWAGLTPVIAVTWHGEVLGYETQVRHHPYLPLTRSPNGPKAT